MWDFLTINDFGNDYYSCCSACYSHSTFKLSKNAAIESTTTINAEGKFISLVLLINFKFSLLSMKFLNGTNEEESSGVCLILRIRFFAKWRCKRDLSMTAGHMQARFMFFIWTLWRIRDIQWFWLLSLLILFKTQLHIFTCDRASK